MIRVLWKAVAFHVLSRSTSTVRPRPDVALSISRSSWFCLRGRRCTARLSAPAHSMRAMYSPVSPPTSSQRVARNRAGFFVSNSPDAVKRYAAGRLVRFADGQQRSISHVEQAGAYLNVFVSGDVLDGARNGYPNRLSVPSAASPDMNEAATRQ